MHELESYEFVHVDLADNLEYYTLYLASLHTNYNLFKLIVQLLYRNRKFSYVNSMRCVCERLEV